MWFLSLYRGVCCIAVLRKGADVLIDLGRSISTTALFHHSIPQGALSLVRLAVRCFMAKGTLLCQKIHDEFH